MNLTRYHGVLAPNHRWRGLVTPAKRGKGVKPIADMKVRSPAECHVAMTWAQRLKRVFNIDIEVCSRCGGSVRVIACIEDQEAIDRILTHLRDKEQGTPTLPHLGHCLFSQEANPQPQRQVSTEATKIFWPTPLRAALQKWADMNSLITDGNKISGR